MIAKDAKRRRRIDCVNVQVDLSLRWAHTSECTFSHVVTEMVLRS